MPQDGQSNLKASDMAELWHDIQILSMIRSESNRRKRNPIDPADGAGKWPGREHRHVILRSGNGKFMEYQLSESRERPI